VRRRRDRAEVLDGDTKLVQCEAEREHRRVRQRLRHGGDPVVLVRADLHDPAAAATDGIE
jgi:hypothetical protein